MSCRINTSNNHKKTLRTELAYFCVQVTLTGLKVNKKKWLLLAFIAMLETRYLNVPKFLLWQ